MEPMLAIMEYDDKQKVLEQFPAERYLLTEVKSEDEARMTTAMMAIQHGAVFGEARWFSDGTGLVIIERSQLKGNEPKAVAVTSELKTEQAKPKKSFLRRLFGG